MKKGVKKKRKKNQKPQDTLIGIIVKIIIFERVYSMFIFAAKTQDCPIWNKRILKLNVLFHVAESIIFILYQKNY